MKKSESGGLVGEAFVDTVENQIRDGDPREVKSTLERLMRLGETRESAIRSISSILAAEIFETFQTDSPFDEASYIRKLKALPE